MTIKYYAITPEQFEKTEYRPLDITTIDIETEDGWDLGDIIDNAGEGYAADLMIETADGLKIWHIYEADSLGDPNDGEYLVQLP